MYLLWSSIEKYLQFLVHHDSVAAKSPQNMMKRQHFENAPFANDLYMNHLEVVLYLT